MLGYIQFGSTLQQVPIHQYVPRRSRNSRRSNSTVEQPAVDETLLPNRARPQARRQTHPTQGNLGSGLIAQNSAVNENLLPNRPRARSRAQTQGSLGSDSIAQQASVDQTLLPNRARAQPGGPTVGSLSAASTVHEQTAPSFSFRNSMTEQSMMDFEGHTGSMAQPFIGGSIDSTSNDMLSNFDMQPGMPFPGPDIYEALRSTPPSDIQSAFSAWLSKSDGSRRSLD